MRDLGTKMAELKFEAPLAKFEETDEWGGCDFITNQNTINDTLNLNIKDPAMKQEAKIRLLEEAVRDANVSKNGALMMNGTTNAVDKINGGAISPNCNSMLAGELGLDVGLAPGDDGCDKRSTSGDTVDNFSETFGGSLEDLVNTFDEKITKCFGNFEENVEDLAPVQVRSQEEIMNECQMWWTITGNFGNILPIDWSKSFTRQMHMPTLNLGQNKLGGGSAGNSLDVTTPGDELTSEDEAVANDLDMHALILNGLNAEQEEPIKSVEEVIKEIDDIMDEAESPLDEAETCESEVIEKAREVLGAPLYAEKLQYLSISQLNELYMEMEMLIQELSETLINELALRDELEYEKELKNSFISLLLAVQNKRRQYHVEKKRGKLQGPEPKYLTTVIPYHMENGTPNNQSLQVLIKILKAINEDSPTVPALLTDYILKVLCPT
ncbi:fasciculation and elongation protein zeta-2 isoform X1 [Ceratitis capitata]|uniref:Fasciculation and elongation protein zeta-2 n=1 Tax=Ceratitis capitata TaxID=7213 RepID=W8B648_CERCA|nr:fasciculation and elongation protein zeta-2 isoform X1 [Ceratitis capitata]